MVSNCCCGDRCNLKSQPADKHWCPGCKRPIHSICGILDESQNSIAYMNWCHDCDEGRKMPAQQLTQRPCASQQKPPQPTRKKSAPPSAPKPIVADIPLEPPPADNKKQSVRASSRSKGPFKIVVPATQQTDPLTGRQVAFPLNGSDRPQWLNNPILQEYGEEFAGTQYLLGNVSRSKTLRRWVSFHKLEQVKIYRHEYFY